MINFLYILINMLEWDFIRLVKSWFRPQLPTCFVGFGQSYQHVSGVWPQLPTFQWGLATATKMFRDVLPTATKMLSWVLSTTNYMLSGVCRQLSICLVGFLTIASKLFSGCLSKTTCLVCSFPTSITRVSCYQCCVHRQPTILWGLLGCSYL